MSRNVHLVGSVPLRSAEEVFRAASRILGARASRLPDGETGVRKNWINWQYELFAAHPLLEPDTSPVEAYRYPPVRLRPGVTPLDVVFPPLGYAAHALESYATFARLKADGVLGAGVRFQVCLPTPRAPVATFVVPREIPAMHARYAAAMDKELRAIFDGIPHGELALQWDVAVEMAIWEGVFPRPPGDWQERLTDELAALGARVPEPIEVGYHFCYGDRNHQHFAQPKDTSNLVELASRVIARLPRPPAWVHLPVPRDRDDLAYFAPLERLALPEATTLFLGLVHLGDGEAGGRRRIAAAERFAPSFGIATECGFGRRDPATVVELLRLHATLAQ